MAEQPVDDADLMCVSGRGGGHAQPTPLFSLPVLTPPGGKGPLPHDQRVPDARCRRVVAVTDGRVVSCEGR